MTILFGHPTGTPFAHHAALAHFEAGVLESFCVPWMPSVMTLRLLGRIAPLKPLVQRLSRRSFQPLSGAPKIQGRFGEMRRLVQRALGRSADPFTYEANEWLMRTMARECDNSRVTAVHAYEDCSLQQFKKAKRLDKACIYDMPIGYYSAWNRIQADLARKHRDWLPADSPLRLMNSDAKRAEMEIADVVLAPSRFVADTIRECHLEKAIALAPYGVDVTGWPVRVQCMPRSSLTFLFVGHCSLRKGVPLLLEAWRAAGIPDACLHLVGAWQLAEEKKRELPHGCSWHGPVSTSQLRDFYCQADVFVFPTNFEGRALVIGEALASGLPVLTTPASGAEDMIDDTCGRIVPSGNLEALVESLRWFVRQRDRMAGFQRAARAKVEQCTWENYRLKLTDAVRPYL